jgi:Xaa-Pro aminopeptidase
MILPAAPVQYRSHDTERPYRADSELFWLTGLTAPGVVAVLRAEAGEPHLTLFVPPRDPKEELWSGPRPDPEAVGEQVGADQVHPTTAMSEVLPKILDESDSVYIRLGGNESLESLVVEALRRSRGRGQRGGTGPRRVVDPGEILDELRLRKDPYEVERIRQAAAITLRGFRALEAELAPGVPEWRLQAVLESVFRGEGGDGPAYPSIVASGSNACVLHYAANDRVAGPGDLVLVDAGAAVGLYAADVTRTYPVSRRFTPEQGAVYEVVDQARHAAVEAIRPGTSIEEVHVAAVTRITEGLVELGLLEGEVEGLVEQEAHKPFFPHQTSHWLGLDVHDVGAYGRAGVSRVLEPGMVLTVEPGLYFGAGAMDAAAEKAGRYAGLGVRLEDDVLVTPDGWENLTGALPTAGWVQPG